MTAQQIEAPPSPYVSLYTRGIAESEALVLTASNAKSDPAEAIRQALLAERLVVIQSAKEKLSKVTVLTAEGIVDVLDAIWRTRAPALSKFIGPSVAEAYAKAFRSANQGDVPIKLIYSLADKHVKRTGDYFHQTSSDALIQGFNTFVNRQVPAKAAFARVIEGYGMTPRQMSGLTSAKYFDSKVETAASRSVTTKVRNYIAKSIKDRLNIFGRQEAHNLNQQAQQVSWMWMVEHGKLPKTAEKMWLTARDERVCGICGPLHRAKVPVGEQFILEDGQKLYVPGAHTNCRCKVRLQLRMEVVGKAERFVARQHPRGAGGRFVESNARMQDPQLDRLIAEAKRAQQEEREAARKTELATPPAPAAPSAPQQLEIALPSTPTAPAETVREAPLQLALPSVGIAPIQLATGKLAALGISSAPQLSVPAQLATPSETTRQEFAAPAPSATALAVPRLQLSAPQALQLQTELVTASREVAEEAKAKQARPKHIEEYTNTEPFKDADGRQVTVYGMVNYGDAYNEENEDVVLTDEKLFRIAEDFQAMDDKGEMWKTVLEKYWENQNKLYARITTGKDLTYIQTEIAGYGRAEGTVESDAILAAIESLGATPDTSALSGKQYEIVWTDPNDDQVEVKREEATAWEIARYLGIHSDQVSVDLVQLDQAYEGDIDYNVGSEWEAEYWQAPGEYDVIHPEMRRLNFASKGDKSSDYGIPVRFLHIAPREEVKFTVEREMTADEIERHRPD